MPTQHDYESTAVQLRQTAASYRDTLAWVPHNPSMQFVGPGPVADQIESRFAGVLRSLHTAVAELEAAARQCDHRAEVCAEYRRAKRQYWSTPDAVRLHMREPRQPAYWVDA